MKDKTLYYVDYLKLLHIFKQYASMSSVQDSILSLKPVHSLKEIEERLDRIEAILEVIKWDGKLPLSDIPDTRGILKRLVLEDSILDIREFVLISGFLRACEDIREFLKKAHHKQDFVVDAIERIKPGSLLYRKIVRTINSEGFIEDTASYELSRIRADLFSARERVKARLEKIMERDLVRPVLQDSYISIRNGRYVIPLKPNFNEAFQGIVHDYSHSLKTSFVEPMETVDLNNTINILEKEEKEEEKVILKDLTSYARGFSGEIETNLAVVEELDLLHSLALFAADYRCVRPQVTPDGEMEIKGAVNPFIYLTKKEQTVPIDIVMEKQKKVMVISGPNAGGKTAALKTIGLLAAMAQSGFFVPSQGTPLIPLFPSIAAIVGDEQDISMELSSFTAHISAIKEVYERAKGGELVLIDEIGGNTEPQEASALAMAIMDAFVDKGCSVVVTTHLNLLKAYGYTRPFAINVATAFDPESMRSAYRLLYGTAGYSNAIKVAQNINLPKAIVDKSYEYLGTQEYMLNDLISALELGKKRVEEEQQVLRRIKDEARKRVSELKERKGEYLRRLEERCSNALLDLEREIEEAKKEVTKKEKSSIRKAKETASHLRNKYVRSTGSSAGEQEHIRVGDYVKIRTLGSRGHVVGLDEERDMLEVATGNIRTKVNRKFVEKLGAGPESFLDKKIVIDVEPIQEPLVNVMGMRVEDALEEVDRFLDRALVQGTPRVKVLHGIGTGRLMSAVKKHLTGVDYVKSLEKDERNSGVTIVELR
jgi:DNA mismatch repair protein MutS2